METNCRTCAFYNHIYDEMGFDAQCGGLCYHDDMLTHGVSGLVEPNGTCANWTKRRPNTGYEDDDLPFTDPPELEDDKPTPTKAETLAHLRAELAKGERFVALMKRFIAVLEKDTDDAP
jgi:hypothetical protein